MDHDKNMLVAIREAKCAFDEGEVPVGAALFMGDKLIASAHNRKEQSKTATAHAEILTINEACRVTSDWRLNGAVLYVTAEPCFMCAGAILQSRIKQVVFGIKEPKFGGVVTHAFLFDIKALNHRVEYISGVREEEIKKLMRDFFHNIR